MASQPQIGLKSECPQPQIHSSSQEADAGRNAGHQNPPGAVERGHPLLGHEVDPFRAPLPQGRRHVADQHCGHAPGDATVASKPRPPLGRGLEQISAVVPLGPCREDHPSTSKVTCEINQLGALTDVVVRYRSPRMMADHRAGAAQAGGQQVLCEVPEPGFDAAAALVGRAFDDEALVEDLEPGVAPEILGDVGYVHFRLDH